MSDNFLRKHLSVLGKSYSNECLTYSAGAWDSSVEKQKTPLCRRGFLSTPIMKARGCPPLYVSTLFFATQKHGRR